MNFKKYFTNKFNNINKVEGKTKLTNTTCLSPAKLRFAVQEKPMVFLQRKNSKFFEVEKTLKHEVFGASEISDFRKPEVFELSEINDFRCPEIGDFEGHKNQRFLR